MFIFFHRLKFSSFSLKMKAAFFLILLLLLHHYLLKNQHSKDFVIHYRNIFGAHDFKMLTGF